MYPQLYASVVPHDLDDFTNINFWGVGWGGGWGWVQALHADYTDIYTSYCNQLTFIQSPRINIMVSLLLTAKICGKGSCSWSVSFSLLTSIRVHSTGNYKVNCTKQASRLFGCDTLWLYNINSITIAAVIESPASGNCLYTS